MAGKHCTMCGGNAAMKCGQCGTPYCTRKCQIRAWEGGHSANCSLPLVGGAEPQSAPPAPRFHPGKSGPDLSPYTVPQPPKKGEVENPLVVERPKPAAAKTVAAPAPDLAWLVGKPPYYMLDFMSAPAPVRMLYDTETSAIKLIEAVRQFERAKLYLEGPPQIPKHNVAGVVAPILRGIVDETERAKFKAVIAQADILRDAFNSTMDALWAHLQLAGATDVQLKRAYDIMLVCQDSITRVKNPSFPFSVEGCALREVQMGHVQRLFELVDEIALAGNPEASYVVQNTGTLVGRMCMTLILDNEEYAIATAEQLARQGDTFAAELLAGGGDDEVAKRAAAAAIAGGRDVVEAYRARMSPEDYAFCTALLAYIEECEPEQGRTTATSASFISGQSSTARFMQKVVWALGVLYIVSVIIDVCFGGGEATSAITTMMPTIGGALAISAAARNPGNSRAENIIEGVQAALAMRSPNNAFDVEVDAVPTLSLDDASNVISEIYTLAEELNDKYSTLGMVNGIPVIDDVLAAASDDYEQAVSRFHESEKALETQQSLIFKRAADQAKNVDGFMRTIDNQQKQVDALLASARDAPESLALREQVAETYKNIQTHDYHFIVDKTLLRLRKIADLQATSKLWQNDAIVVARPPLPDIKATVEDVVQGLIGSELVKTDLAQAAIKGAYRAIYDDWETVSKLAQARGDDKRALSDVKQELELRRLQQQNIAQLETTLANIMDGRTELEDFAASHRNLVKIAEEAEAARRRKEAASIVSDVLSGKWTDGIDDVSLAVEEALSESRQSRIDSYLQSGYLTMVEDPGSVWGRITGVLLNPFSPDLRRGYLNMHLVLESVAFGAGDVSEYYQAHMTAMVSTLASTKMALGATYHLLKVSAAYGKFVDLNARTKLKKARRSVEKATGGVDFSELASGLYSTMSSAISVKGNKASTPFVATTYSILCRSAFLANLAGFTASTFKHFGFSASEGVISAFAKNMVVSAASIAIAAYGAYHYRETVKSVLGGIRYGDLALQRLIIRQYLRLIVGAGVGAKAAKCAEKMIELSNSNDALTNVDAWEALKLRVLDDAKNRTYAEGLVELDVWYSGLTAILSAVGSLIIAPELNKRVRTLLIGMNENADDRKLMIGRVMVASAKAAPDSAHTNVHEMLYLLSRHKTDFVNRTNNGLEIIKEQLMRNASAPYAIKSMTIPLDDVTVMAKTAVILQNILDTMPSGPPIDSTTKAFDTLKAYFLTSSDVRALT